MIQVQNLSKRFGDLRAVDDVSFELREGEIYGLLGPNGAGKTTTISILAGLLEPDEGKVLFDGVDIARDPIATRRRLGVVPQEIALYEELTAAENLRFWGGLYGLSGDELKQAIGAILEKVGLITKADVRVKTYSGGMKRRLNLALGLVHRPKVVLMDEPTVGIDVQARVNILDVVRAVASSGTTVLYTTHYLEEAESLCNRIGIVDNGKVLAEGTLGELKTLLGEEEVVTVTGRFLGDEARQSMEGFGSARVVSADDGRLVLTAAGDGNGAVELLSHVLHGKLAVDGVSIQPPSLNGLFLKLTGKELRD
jgi:ABC-2 type transport system ATP-binding protein